MDIAILKEAGLAVAAIWVLWFFLKRLFDYLMQKAKTDADSVNQLVKEFKASNVTTTNNIAKIAESIHKLVTRFETNTTMTANTTSYIDGKLDRVLDATCDNSNKLSVLVERSNCNEEKISK